MIQQLTFKTLILILALVTLAEADYEAGQRAWDAGQRSEAMAEWQSSAQAGDTKAMLALGWAYVQGMGVLQDYVQAYKWFNLAASRGEGAAVAERDALTAEMSLQERAEGRKLALEYQPDSAATEASTVRPAVSQEETEAETSVTLPAVSQEDMSAEAIREVQSLLTTLGYRPGPVDGYWGRRTNQALQAFLRDSSLPPPNNLTESLRILRGASQRAAPAQAEPPLLKPFQVKIPQEEIPQEEMYPFTVIAYPAVASVRFVNSEEPYVPGMVLPPGGYEVEVNASGYWTKRETIKHETKPTARRVVLVKAEPRRQVGERFRDCPVCPEVVVVPAGSFLMGALASEEGYDDTEGPQVEVTIAQPLAVGVYEVTFAEWNACVSNGGCNGFRPDDAGWGRRRQPVIDVSWADAQAYVRWLAEETGRAYRLPSEAEWEYATRAGTQTPFHFGRTITPPQANYDALYIYGGGWKGLDRRRTIPVGSFLPNTFGLYDVHGNAWEWTQDCWNSDHSEALRDGRARTSGDCSRRILRGGSWIFSPKVLRSASRHGYASDYRYFHVGFRVARTLPYLIPPGTNENGPKLETATLPDGTPADGMGTRRTE